MSYAEDSFTDNHCGRVYRHKRRETVKGLATWSLFLPTGLCLRTPYMPLIIMSVSFDVQSYLAFCEHPDVSAIRPKRCVHCGRVHPLQRHSSYERTVWFRLRAYRIRVYRFQCGACKRTVSVLPTILSLVAVIYIADLIVDY